MRDAIAAILLGCLVWAGPALAQDKTFRLAAPDKLVATGLLQYMLPRFSLKTGTRVSVVGAQEEAEARLARDGGRAVFTGPDGVWRLDTGDDPHAQRFAKWLGSDVGRRAVDAYAPDGDTLFSSEVRQQVAVAEVSFDGDAAAGEDLSMTHCGRCHVISEKNRMNAIGSTPSFAVLRTLSDWDQRFETFYVLNPHPAFTQIEGVSLPFDPTRPSPIVPVEMSLDDLEAILAFVALIPPADLGAPMQIK